MEKNAMKAILAVLLCSLTMAPRSATAQCMNCIALPPLYVGFCGQTPVGYTQCSSYGGGLCANGGDECPASDDAELLPSGEVVSAREEGRADIGSSWVGLEVSARPVLLSSGYNVRRDCRGRIRERYFDARAGARQGGITA